LDQKETEGFGPRFYRDKMGENRFKSFVVQYKDSDLWIGVDTAGFDLSMIGFAQEKLIEVRQSLERYIIQFPLFASSFSPIDLKGDYPEIALKMSKAATIAGTGPMAAVAGAFSEYIGKSLQKAYPIKEIVVENGGDIYMDLASDLLLSIYAGASNLSEKIGLKIPYNSTPLGVCTSAGKVGPSISFGKADAVMIACKDTALADAYATAFGNKVKTGSDIALAIEQAKTFTEIASVVIVCENKLGISGQFELLPLAQ
jgi:ApbE superfamily uncharacterized protein (UPF0280 family)